MIVAAAIVLLAALSVHVRRVINGTAMFLVCLMVWTLMMIAMPLESPRRAWRLAGVIALVITLAAGWKVAGAVAGALRHLP